MDGDLTDILLDAISDSGVEYTEPEDLISAEEVELFTYLETPGVKIPRTKNIPFEKVISNYQLPPDLSEEEIREIFKHVGHYGKPWSVIHTEETRRRISIANTGLRKSEETRKKISTTMTGMKHTIEHNQRISKAMAGKKRKPMSEETKEKIRQARLKKEIKSLNME